MCLSHTPPLAYIGLIGLLCCNARLMYYIIEVIVQVFIVYSQYIGYCRVPEGYVASRLTMSNKVYMLQMSDNKDPKLLSKIITICYHHH